MPCFSLGVVRSRWKAAIDFKWIRENKDLVAENIKKRNASADLDLVLELYEKMCGVQKVRDRLLITSSFFFFCYYGPLSVQSLKFYCKNLWVMMGDWWFGLLTWMISDIQTWELWITTMIFTYIISVMWMLWMLWMSTLYSGGAQPIQYYSNIFIYL